MKRFLVIVFCLFFYSTFAWAETFTSRQLLSDDETFTVDSGDTYYYDGNKVIDAVGHSNVTVINNGNIIMNSFLYMLRFGLFVCFPQQYNTMIPLILQ